MKPALLYLRKYIDEHYQHNRANRQQDKENLQKGSKKYSQEPIFNQRKVYQCQNTKLKEFYFKSPKTINGTRFKQKIISQIPQSESHINPIRVQPYSRQTQRSSVELKANTQRSSVINTSGQNSPAQSDEGVKNKEKSKNMPPQKSVRFVISSPVQKTPNFSSTPSGIQSPKEIEKKSWHKIETIKEQQIVSDELDQVIDSSVKGQETPELIKSEHFKIFSKSMKKIGYNTLSDYLEEMKKYNRIKKEQIKEACYYPLACLTPKNSQTYQYELTKKQQKAYFQTKHSNFQKQITIHDDFSAKTVALRKLSHSKSHKPKSNFGKTANPLHEDIGQKKSKQFLLEYDQIVMCNCANKKYFSYKLSSNTDYNSFFRFTTPLLDTKPQKDNNYLIGNKDSQSFGLYFCCLINSSLGVRQGFFWIGKPIQYYRKDKVIQMIDDFVFDVGVFAIFESDRLWIVDNHGKNSHIMKSLLKKCNDQTNTQQSKQNFSSIVKKGRVAKKLSLSMSQQSNTQNSEMYMSLLANFSQFRETGLFKKQINNVSTRGAFKLIYQPTQSYYDKNKTNDQSTV